MFGPSLYSHLTKMALLATLDVLEKTGLARLLFGAAERLPTPRTWSLDDGWGE